MLPWPCAHPRTARGSGLTRCCFVPYLHTPPSGRFFWKLWAPAGSGSHWDPSPPFAEAPWLLHLRAGHHRGGAAAPPRAPAPAHQPAVPRLRGHGGPGAAPQVPATPAALCCPHQDDFQQISGRTWCRIPFSLCLRCLRARPRLPPVQFLKEMEMVPHSWSSCSVSSGSLERFGWVSPSSLLSPGMSTTELEAS